jgi:hypothetical protein
MVIAFQPVATVAKLPTRFVDIYAFVVQIYAFAVLFGVSHVTLQSYLHVYRHEKDR